VHQEETELHLSAASRGRFFYETSERSGFIRDQRSGRSGIEAGKAKMMSRPLADPATAPRPVGPKAAGSRPEWRTAAAPAAGSR